VRSLQLQAALSEFAEQAANRLHADVLAGEEVRFELASHNARARGASPLYCYRPLTDAYIAERFDDLRRLDAYPTAVRLLGAHDGLDRYLLSVGVGQERPRGVARDRAEAALLALLRETFEEQTDFQLRPERLERALERLDGSALAAAAGEVTLVGTLHGLTIGSPEVSLTRGLTIARPDALQGVPEEVVGAARGDGAEHLLVVFTAEDPDPRAGIAKGKSVVYELLRALRLFGDGRIALGALAWTRIGSAPWETIALGRGGKPHGMLVVGTEQEDELRAFCELVSRRAPHESEIAWALRRFELGCERSDEYEGISDHLLALRALLGDPPGHDPDGSSDGIFAGRLAALCAAPDHRTALAERALRAIALERQAIAGEAPRRASGVRLARDLSNHLRALLRDVVCGHLPGDLAALADELLLSGEESPADGGSSEQGSGEQGSGERGSSERGSGEQGSGEQDSGEQTLGDQPQAADVLHVAV
jgi:hypothetical protein